ncbi:MAG: hypothetical protein RIQ31_458, partial [Actinomycetota bacterium]
AVLGTVLFTATQASAEARLQDTAYVQQLPEAAQDEFIAGLTDAVVDSAGAALPGIGEFAKANFGASEESATEIQTAANDGFTDGVKATGWAAAGFLALGLISTFSMGSKRRRNKE